MRSVFFGSPDFAVPCLEALHEISEVATVISQPDRPAGRGLAMRPPAVKQRALELGLDVWQPKKVRTPDFAERLRELGADVGVVVAYGRILPRAVLEAPRTGCVNVHASLLPRWRGAAPIQWSIVNGDPETGVTLMQMDEGMDTGPILATATTVIERNDDAASLSERRGVDAERAVRRTASTCCEAISASLTSNAAGQSTITLLKYSRSRVMPIESLSEPINSAGLSTSGPEGIKKRRR